MKKLLLILGIIVCCQACTEQPQKISRGRDPWIFRVNLDYMPRMIVLAMNVEMWAAYDAQHARLYKIWKGGISFNGPMYDDRHNVQPSTRGVAYSQDTLMQSPWRLLVNGIKKEVKAEYLGYTLHNETATINYRIPTGTAKDILIHETPDYVTDKNGRPGFKRIFETANVPEGTTVGLRTGLHAEENDVTTSGNTVFLKSNAITNLTAFFKPVSVPMRQKIKKPGEEAGGVIPQNDTNANQATSAKGRQLISMNDCAACHTLDTRAIGPSFKMIAEKYDTGAVITDRLANKVITGGTGVWGRQAMTPHKELSLSDAVPMVRYILSLDSNSIQKKTRGIAASFYTSGVLLTHNPVLIPGQNPNLSTVVPDLEFTGTDMSINRITNDFLGFEDQFIMHLSGYIEPPQAGRYELLLKANAGARLFINGKKVDEVDYSNYDYQQKKAFVELHSGPNAFRVEYYEDIYSSNLNVRWRKPGEKEFSKIPESAFTHDPSDIKKSSPGLKEIYQITTPGFGAPLVSNHPAFDVTTVRPSSFNRRISALKFLPDGRLAVATWDSTGSIYLLDGVLGKDIEKIKPQLFAKGLYEIMGLEYVDGKIYPLQKWELTELTDTDKDGMADEYRVALDDWTASANFHEWAFGLLYRDGYFYLNTAISLGGNGVLTDSGINRIEPIQTKDRGKTLKIRKSDWTFEALAHGYKAPNGIGFGVDNEIFTTDNEGHMVPTNKMMHVPQSGYPFFGNDEVLRQLSMPVPKFKQPVIWMPTGEVSNSPSQPVVFKMGPFQDNQMVVGDVHHGGLNRMFIEKINGEYQGVIFPFTQGLEAGITRLAWGPDHNLYMAGLGAGGDFGHMGQCCGLQRFSYNGKAVLDMVAIRAKSDGMEIEFTEPLKAGQGNSASDYTIQQFWYETGENVPEGGVKNDIENLKIMSVNLSADRKKVFLQISEMKKEHVIYIKINKPFVSAAGNSLWTGDAWYTLNNIPQVSGFNKNK